MFPDVHAAGKHDLHLFRACGRETLRGFFDTLKRPVPRNRALAVQTENSSSLYVGTGQ